MNKQKISFSNVKFLRATLDDFPAVVSPAGQPLPEVIIAGRSNVGKSSLINHLAHQKNLARTSSTPGKTTTINFFLVDDALLLVDLPGYGFAKRSKTDQDFWSHSIDAYLKTRTSLSMVLLLIDSRRKLCDEDIALAKWAQHLQKQLLIIFTKSDTLPDHERVRNSAAIVEYLGQTETVYYSIKDGRSRTALIHKINNLLLRQ